MERIIKLLLVVILTGFVCPALAETPQPNVLGAPQTLTLPQCIKTFNVGYEKLFLLTEAAISDNNFNVLEMQTKGVNLNYIVLKTKLIRNINFYIWRA